MKNITIVGTGYVGLSLAVLLAKKIILLLTIFPKKKSVKSIKEYHQLKMTSVQSFLTDEDLSLNATSEIAAIKMRITLLQHLQTMMSKKFFVTSSVEKVIDEIVQINEVNDCY